VRALAACIPAIRAAALAGGGHAVDKKNLEGKLDKMKGKIKEIGGIATDNRDWESEGKVDQVKGKVKEGLGNLREGIKDKLDELDEEKDEDR